MSTGNGLLRLSLACGRYDINQALIDGSIQPQGTQLTVMTFASPERHRRMSRGLEFDLCEFSLATTIALHCRAAFSGRWHPSLPASTLPARLPLVRAVDARGSARLRLSERACPRA